MTREELYTRIADRLQCKQLTGDKKLAYFERLIKPYTKKQQTKVFITQYLKGDGHELNRNFWSVRSSSRFAFELYSWMACDRHIRNIEFEKKLKTIRGARRPPNMDVYIETEDDRVIFIENKFCEQYAPSVATLSDSYYEEKAKNSKQDLQKRYYGQKNLAQAAQALVDETRKQLAEKGLPNSWMDYKQEITHLIGIMLTVALNESGDYLDKDVKFYNVHYVFHDEADVDWFFEKANELIGDQLTGKCKSFEYAHYTAQEMVRKKELFIKDEDKNFFSPNTPAYTSDTTIGEILKKYFEFEIKP